MMKIAITHSVGVVLVLASTSYFFMNFNQSSNEWINIYLPLMILVIGLFFGMRKTKKEIYKNEVTFGQVIYSGIVISFFVALGLGIYNFLYFEVIDNNYVDKILSIEIPIMEKNNLSLKQILRNKETIRDIYDPMNQLKGTFVFIFVAGIAFSAILSSILRTKDTFTEIVKRG